MAVESRIILFKFRPINQGIIKLLFDNSKELETIHLCEFHKVNTRFKLIKVNLCFLQFAHFHTQFSSSF